jgi:CRISPR type III-A-associated protein Csm2
MWDKKDLISITEIQEKITADTVSFAERFGKYLAQNDDKEEPLTTSQLRKFFGEVKRQQMTGYDDTEFVMLKPKLAYAVGRAHARQNGKRDKYLKIEDFYIVMADAIDKVVQSTDKNKAFNNFITAFEAVVAYHKAAEKK